MSLCTKKILGIDISVSPKADILEEVRKYLNNFQFSSSNFQKLKNEPLIIFTPNPEILTYSRRHQSFKKIVAEAQINLPDGAGICWALRKKYGLKTERVAGSDFMLDMVRLSEKNGFTIGLIGGFSNLALETAECLRRMYPKAIIKTFSEPNILLATDTESGRNYRIENGENEAKSMSIVSCIKYLVSCIYNNIFSKKIQNTIYIILNTKKTQPQETEAYFQDLAEKLIKQKIDILFVALGFPKQEHFIDELVSYLLLVHRKDGKRNNNYSERTNQLTMNPLVLMAVGGSLDYISGRIPRAPLWMSDRGLEWLFRLIREPWRLKRQIRGARFFLDILASQGQALQGQALRE